MYLFFNPPESYLCLSSNAYIVHFSFLQELTDCGNREGEFSGAFLSRPILQNAVRTRLFPSHPQLLILRFSHRFHTYFG